MTAQDIFQELKFSAKSHDNLIAMQAKVSFFVRGSNPYQDLRRLVLQNGILRNDFGLRQSIVSQRQIGPSTHLFQLSLHDLQRLQFQQGIPFEGFKGEPAQPFEPKSVLVVSKGVSEETHLETMAAVERTLKGLEVRHRVVNLADLKQGHFRNRDLVLTVGGDGTHLGSAHFVKNDTPMFGIVSDPQTAKTNPLGSWGHYMLLTANDLDRAFNLMAQGDFELAALTRLESILRVGGRRIPTVLALNEIFINEQDSAQGSRYSLEVAGLREWLYDSGALIATGSGSAANAWISNSLGLSFSSLSILMQFKAREPQRFVKDGTERVLLHGFTDCLVVHSHLLRNPRVSIEGAARHYPFPAGSALEVRASDHPLSFLVFPSISTKDMPDIARPMAEVSTPQERLNLSADQIKEIDALPVCGTVLPGTKRQILFLRVTRDMDKLRLARILKTGGVPLTQADFDLEATVDRPTLLYPTAEISSLPAVIRDIVLGLYGYGVRITEYAGTIVEHDSSVDKNVWAPSIDTIVFLRGILDHGIFNDQIVSAAEIGTGSGAIAKAALQHCSSLRDLVITDVEQNALVCAQRNLVPVASGIEISGIWGKGIKKVGKVDLLLVNPPYLPEKKDSGEVDQYRGLGLIEEVLRDGKDHLNPGGSMVINYSSCAGKEFRAWAKKYGWQIKPLLKISVPLKIVRVNNDPAWLDFMLEHGGLEIRDEVSTGYRYWHTLNVVQLTPD